MSLPVVAAGTHALDHLPVPTRPRLDPPQSRVAGGYGGGGVLVGLSMPTGMGSTTTAPSTSARAAAPGPPSPAGRPEGRIAGASSGVWRDLRELLLANLDAVSASAVAQQLGLAQGRPRVVEVA